MKLSTQAPTVLVADDEPDFRELARVYLELDGFEVIDLAADGGEVLQRFIELDPPPMPTAVLLDNRMPVMTGLEVAEQILTHNPDQVVVLFSAHLDDEVERAACELGVRACVSKMSANELPSILRGLLDH